MQHKTPNGHSRRQLGNGEVAPMENSLALGEKMADNYISWLHNPSLEHREYWLRFTLTVLANLIILHDLLASSHRNFDSSLKDPRE